MSGHQDHQEDDGGRPATTTPTTPTTTTTSTSTTPTTTTHQQLLADIVIAADQIQHIAFQNQLLTQTRTFPWGTNRVNLKPVGTGLTGCLPHDDGLIPYWEGLASAMGRKRIRHVKIENVELRKNVLDILKSGLDAEHLQTLELVNANFGVDEFLWMAKFLKEYRNLVVLALDGNGMCDMGNSGLSVLFRSLRKHPSLAEIRLNGCSLGNNLGALSQLLEAVQSKKISLGLSDNKLESPGASVVAKFLKSNPNIDQLKLNNNNFDDNDASLLGSALPFNTNLGKLELFQNKFSHNGHQSILKGIYDDSSLNNVITSNHTCLLIWNHPPIPHLPKINNVSSARWNKRKKMNYALRISEEGPIHLGYLSDVPVGLMPRVIPLFHVSSPLRAAQGRCLTNMFELIRNWKMPTLFGFAGTCPLRGEQI